MTVHTLRYSRKSFCLDLFRQLHDSPKANEWERACAVYALGFWNCPLTLIKDAYFDTELLVRKAGEEALAIRSKREHLTRHMKTFEIASGQQRLLCYLCLLHFSTVVGADGTSARISRRSSIQMGRLAGIYNLHWHDLRHTFGTRLAEAGFSEATIADLMGHSDPETTRRYTMLLIELKELLLRPCGLLVNGSATILPQRRNGHHCWWP